MVWRLTRVVVPVLLIGAIIASYVVSILPDSGNNITGVVTNGLFAIKPADVVLVGSPTGVTTL